MEGLTYSSRVTCNATGLHDPHCCTVSLVQQTHIPCTEPACTLQAQLFPLPSGLRGLRNAPPLTNVVRE